MIPDFKTYINETYWSNMNKRAQGTIVRKEDNTNIINKYDGDEMVEYISDNYEFTQSGYMVDYFEEDLIVPVIYKKRQHTFYSSEETYDLKFEKMRYISINSEEIGEELQDEFKVYIGGEESTIEPKDSNDKMDNVFFIKVLDYIIKRAPSMKGHCVNLIKKKNLNETYWSNMNRRSQGTLTRKEDDINNLDIDGLCKYIKDKYEFITNEPWPVYVAKEAKTDIPYLFVLLFHDSGRTISNIPAYIYFNPVDIQFVPANMPGRNVIEYFRDDKLLDALKSSFDLVEDDKDGRYYHINPLNGEKANNKFILKVLDTFAENSRDPIIKKK